MKDPFTGAFAMRLTPQISFRNLEPGEEIKQRIDEEVRRLEKFYGGIIGCKVMVEVPHHRHRTGDRYRVRIDLTVPGRELVVSRDPGNNDESTNLPAAITAAFDAMQRQLEDYVRRRRGLTKRHEVPAHGRVVRLFPEEGYGFIETPDGRQVYFHEHSVLNGAFNRLRVGSEVRFTEEEGNEGPQATTVRPVGKHHVLGPLE